MEVATVVVNQGMSVALDSFPAHAVGVRDRFGLHQGDSLRREHRDILVPPPVHLDDHEMGHVLSAGDDEASREFGAVVGQRNRDGDPEPPMMPLGHPILPGHSP